MDFSFPIVMNSLFYILCCGICQSTINPPNVVVAKDGTGNYNTIMAAVSAAPNNSITRYYIQIKQGVYEEYVQIKRWKTNIVFIGEGVDKTIITRNKGFGGGIKLYDCASVVVEGDGFMAQDVTFRNTAGPENYQAAALRASADTCTFYRCQSMAFKTHYTHTESHISTGIAKFWAPSTSSVATQLRCSQIA